jgi:2-polyprenyl-6-methoxyphenol hydroxylase-like FAD-dependent oxidoreductase
MHVLISGAGIAGLTLAYCCREAGIECTVVEKADAVRDGGYMIDFFGPGYDAAERLGLLPELEKIHYPVDCLNFLDARGRKRFSISYPDLRKFLDNRHFNFMRGELARVLLRRVEGRMDFRFRTTIQSLNQGSNGVTAALSDHSTIRADLVVGAGGLHSGVRTLSFGEESRFLRFLHCNTAAFVIENPPESLRNAGHFDTLTIPGRQVGIYPIRGGRLATFFLHTAQTPASMQSGESAAAQLRQIYGDMGWIVPELLSRIDPNSLFFDSVSQSQVPQWTNQRVTLLGDASYAVSLVAGQGASLAMAGAYILADELSAAGVDVAAATARYEKRLRPVVEKKQRAARKMARWFLPSNSAMLFLRNSIIRAGNLAPARFLLKRAISPEGIDLSHSPAL